VLKYPSMGDALFSLRPGAVWTCGAIYESIQWLDETHSKPTKEEVEAEFQRLIDEYNNTEYQRLRVKAYPPLAEQMDTLFHQGYDGWRAQIQAIKDQYPKLEE
jgi:hypothetical protein